MIFRSIRFKIILWNMVLLAISVVVCGALAYHSFKFTLYRNLDDLLMTRAIGVTESIDTYWEMEKQAALSQGVHAESFSKINNLNFVKIARHWVETRSNDPKLLNIIIQIFDGKGKLLVSSIDLNEWQWSAPLPLQMFKQKSGHFENIRINRASVKSIEARTFIIPVQENGQIAYFVRLITPLTDVNTQLSQLLMILFGILPLIIFLTGIAGSFLARVSLYPVDRMILAINRITSQNLRLRVDVPGSGDEIQRLAETFNSMLTRIDDHFLTQQRFIQDMSHEIKTPLTIIRGNMEVALKKTRSQERYESILKDSLEQIASITHIVESLLILARFDNREVPLQVKRLNLNNLAMSVLAEMQILADVKDISIEYVERAKIDMAGDEMQLRSLFLNLLDNAVKYTPDHGRVTVLLDAKESLALIEIRDTGIGISEKDLPHVFERFYRVENVGIKEKGFGLGLSLVKSIVETHHGTITVTSGRQKGTTFLVSLPVRLAKFEDK